MKTTNYYATFYSPGTLFSESSTVKVDSLDLIDVLKKAKTISERHGAKPYGFVLEEREEGSIVKDGETYKLEPKTKWKSGTHFITGKILTLEDIPDTSENSILRSNMRGNNYGAVVENRNSWKVTMPFEKKDLLIDWDGKILDKGSKYNK